MRRWPNRPIIAYGRCAGVLRENLPPVQRQPASPTDQSACVGPSQWPDVPTIVRPHPCTQRWTSLSKRSPQNSVDRYLAWDCLTVIFIHPGELFARQAPHQAAAPQAIFARMVSMTRAPVSVCAMSSGVSPLSSERGRRIQMLAFSLFPKVSSATV